MSPMMQKILVGVSLLAIGFIGNFAFTWLSKAEDSHDKVDAVARSQAETEEIQDRIVDAVERLTNIHDEENVAKAQTAKLCREGKISSCRTCREAGVYDAKGCK